MERLLQLFYNNGSFFTFCLLQGLCLFLIVNRNSPQSEIAVETWSLNWGKVKSSVTTVNEYLDMHEQNEVQTREIAKLKSLLPFNRYNTVPEIEAYLDSTSTQRYKYLATRVVNRNPYNLNNTFVIDRGRDLGVSPGQGVVTENGIMGIIDLVTDKHARGISILHGAARVSAGIKSGHYGTLRWPGKDPRYVVVTDIPDFVKIMPNDTVFTTGFSNVFPTGQVIGTVANSAIEPGTGTQTLTVLLINSPLTNNHAYVVQDLFKEEFQVLKDQ